MGKIRVKTLGIEEEEKKQVRDAKKRREAKQVKTESKKTPETVETTTAEISLATKPGEQIQVKDSKKTKKTKASQKKETGKHVHSKRYLSQRSQIDTNRTYALSEAVDLLKKLGSTKFNSTVELHINTTQKGISGQLTLPHGTGKQVRVTIADPGSDGEFDKLVKKIEGGVIDFDVLIATPAAMPKLARVARILGPRGLMPNPKNGTISDNPKSIADKFQGGQINFKTESQAPIIHASVGKLHFTEKALVENIVTFVNAVGASKIHNITLKSTMSPGIKIDFSQFV